MNQPPPGSPDVLQDGARIARDTEELIERENWSRRSKVITRESQSIFQPIEPRESIEGSPVGRWPGRAISTGRRRLRLGHCRRLCLGPCRRLRRGLRLRLDHYRRLGQFRRLGLPHLSANHCSEKRSNSRIGFGASLFDGGMK